MNKQADLLQRMMVLCGIEQVSLLGSGRRWVLSVGTSDHLRLEVKVR